jgi:diketogulonate reductase-like aldo/keto reductase
MDIPTKKLNNGLEMPVVGLGTWQSAEGREVEDAVLWALQSGYRLIDTAKIYGNEQGVGRAISQSKIPREELFITTKLWNTDQGYESGLKAFDESLKRLGLNYIDLYLIHWPFVQWTRGENRRKESWQALEEIYQSGRAKAIGVSNYTIEHLEEMKTYAKILPTINQVEFHPFLFQKELMEYCQKESIMLEAYSPLSRGEKINDSHITKIAEKYKKTNAQIMIRWSIQHGNVVIPKSVSQDRIKDNINVFDFELSAEDMAILDSLNENYRIVLG